MMILVIIYSHNGLPLVWGQAIFRRYNDLLSIVFLGTVNIVLKRKENLSRKRICKFNLHNWELKH